MRSVNRLYVFYFSLGLIALFGGNHILELRAEEPRRAIVALEMLYSGNWLIPTIHGWEYYNKPPLFNWVLALFYGLTNNASEWITRLPSLLALLGTGYLNYKIGKKHLPSFTAFLGSAFYVLCAEVLFYASNAAGEIDLLYGFLVFAQAATPFAFEKSKRMWLGWLLFYFLGALGFLTKGLPSVAFTALTLAGWLWYTKKWQSLFRFSQVGGVMLFGVLIGGYLWLYSQEADLPSWLAKQFWEASHKSANEGTSTEIIKQLLLFPVQVLFLLLPFSVFGLGLFHKSRLIELWRNSWLKWGLIFTLFNIGIYWISPGTRNRYIYMFLPFLANVLAFLAVSLLKKEALVSTLRKLIASLGVLLIIGLFVLISLPEFKTVNYRWTIALLLTPVIGFIVDMALKHKQPLHALLLLMLVAKIGQTFLVLPQWQTNSKQLVYRDTMRHILYLTQNTAPVFYGPLTTQRIELKAGPYVFDTAYVKTPPQMAYQISYYICRETETPFLFSTELAGGPYFMAFEKHLPDSGIVEIYGFEERWKHERVVLFSLASER